MLKVNKPKKHHSPIINKARHRRAKAEPPGHVKIRPVNGTSRKIMIHCLEYIKTLSYKQAFKHMSRCEIGTLFPTQNLWLEKILKAEKFREVLFIRLQL